MEARDPPSSQSLSVPPCTALSPSRSTTLPHVFLPTFAALHSFLHPSILRDTQVHLVPHLPGRPMQRRPRAALRLEIGATTRKQLQRAQVPVPGGTVGRGDPLSVCGADVGPQGRQPRSGLVVPGDESQGKWRQAMVVLVDRERGRWVVVVVELSPCHVLYVVQYRKGAWLRS